MTADFKTIMGILPVIISGLNLVYYLYTVYYGRTRPHIFSWIIWTIVASIAAAGQIVKGAGSGAWITIAIAVFAFIRVVACLTHGEKSITRSDTYCLIACLFALVLWGITNDPLLSVIVVTIVDAVGIYPTWRKSWHKPYEENALSYFLFGVTSAMGLAATENYNLTTMIFPGVIIWVCWGFAAFLVWRRKAMSVTL